VETHAPRNGCRHGRRRQRAAASNALPERSTVRLSDAATATAATGDETSRVRSHSSTVRSRPSLHPHSAGCFTGSRTCRVARHLTPEPPRERTRDRYYLPPAQRVQGPGRQTSARRKRGHLETRRMRRACPPGGCNASRHTEVLAVCAVVLGENLTACPRRVQLKQRPSVLRCGMGAEPRRRRDAHQALDYVTSGGQ
jgi:hypothetical protein